VGDGSKPIPHPVVRQQNATANNQTPAVCFVKKEGIFRNVDFGHAERCFHFTCQMWCNCVSAVKTCGSIEQSGVSEPENVSDCCGVIAGDVPSHQHLAIALNHKRLDPAI
jgi:hypothetical protein